MWPSSQLRKLITQRRSALDFQGGNRKMPKAEFFELLARGLPGQAPLSALPWKPRVHVLVFVHRVEDLESGIYCLVRHHAMLPRLQDAFKSKHKFAWDRVVDNERNLPLYRLVSQDAKEFAKISSCLQDIGANGTAAFAFLAEWRPVLNEFGAWMYRNLHWEAGAIGGAFYVAAEAVGLRATGVGCFFGPLLHEAMGISTETLQDIYHFTVGYPLEDKRLQSLPGYHHLAALRARGGDRGAISTRGV
eukprot:gnl/MRDRNA2_/MRDRNA2_223892_c0_seq1.p1 gnl/MRDRNA2_/MRDRNA2_223892_c0~~gnl/MRDRNA2_/MRDRNA2_223892_c0_seq1.p1  ORF type:complete len:247 (+),score=43.05 gnl/MRDRNA2_/MRDRNA2_223892_c0_seq1:337-1077(+)